MMNLWVIFCRTIEQRNSLFVIGIFMMWIQYLNIWCATGRERSLFLHRIHHNRLHCFTVDREMIHLWIESGWGSQMAMSIFDLTEIWENLRASGPKSISHHKDMHNWMSWLPQTMKTAIDISRQKQNPVAKSSKQIVRIMQLRSEIQNGIFYKWNKCI